MKVMMNAAMGTVIVSLLSACSAPSDLADEVGYQASYPVYECVSELQEAVDRVVEGTVLSSEVREIDIVIQPGDDAEKNPLANPGESESVEPSLMVFTVHKVQVERVVQGVVTEGTTIEVSELGGQLGDTLYASQEGILLQDGRTYLLFLETYDGVPASLLNPVQATYERRDGELTSMPGNSIPAEEASEL